MRFVARIDNDKLDVIYLLRKDNAACYCGTITECYYTICSCATVYSSAQYDKP